MTTFNVPIKLEDLIFIGSDLDYYHNKPLELKNYLAKVYRTKSKSKTNKYKMVNELTAVFRCSSNEPVKRDILKACAFSCSNLGCRRYALATYRSLLLLTFPLLAELTKLALSFGDNYFTPQLLIDKLDDNWFQNEATKDSCCRAAIKTLTEVAVIKTLKRGVMKSQTIPVYDAQGLEAALLTAVELGKGKPNDIDLFLQGLSFEITHDFIEFFNNIDYTAIVPADIWNEFISSDSQHTLQYKQGAWTVSNEPYLYLEINLPLSAIPKANYYTVEDLKIAKNEKKCWDANAEISTNESRVSMQ